MIQGLSTGPNAAKISYMANESFGEMIRRRRMAINISQQWLAEKAGVDQSHLSKIERGKIGAPLEPLRSQLIQLIDNEERNHGVPVEHSLSAEVAITTGGHADLTAVAEAERMSLLERAIFAEAPDLSPAGMRAAERALRGILDEIRGLEAQYKKEAERDAASEQGD